MSRDGLLYAFAGANLAWTLALVFAPLSLPAGTVAGIDGHANLVDHADRWAELPTFQRFVYAAGDLQCHQIGSRSWSLGGNQMPVDVRMFAGFLFGNAGFAWALSRPASWRYRDAAAQILPLRFRGRLDSPQRRLAALVILWGFAAAPMLVDVGAQLASSYESTNLNRLLTGALLGVVGGFLVGAMLRSLMLGGPAPSSTPASRGDH